MFFLKKIKLNNFRCYSNKIYEFKPGKNIITGQNAVGKTSLVEAIYCLCFGKSFRDINDVDLIKKNNDYFYILGEFYGKENDMISLSYDKSKKIVEKNNKKIKSLSEYLGYFNIVVFSPDDLEMVKGSPANRRKFLDVNISQIDKVYLNSSIRYKKILKERNELLKNSELDSYNEELLNILTNTLIDEAKVIIKKRTGFVDMLNEILKVKHHQISSGTEEVQIVYKPKNNVENLLKVSKERHSFDIINKTTTWGPSRDDFSFYMNGQDASTYCSQGQIRSICLSLKLALVDLIEKYNEKIIVVLDDVFSELDVVRQNKLLNMLSNEKQTFITTTSIEALTDDVKRDSNLIEIIGGKTNE